MPTDYLSIDQARQAELRDVIVVGHDGSRRASAALEVALDLAQALQVSLVVVRAWSIDTAPKAPTEKFGYVSSFEEIAAVVRESLVAQTRDTVRKHPSVSADYATVRGQPAEALMALSTGARMLVVGSRGFGGVLGLVLGSVSEQCLRHAPCAVLVVRPHPQRVE